MSDVSIRVEIGKRDCFQYCKNFRMVRLSPVIFVAKSGFDTPFRVNRTRYIARGAEYLFKDYKNVKVSEKFDGTLRLKSNNIIRLALDGCTNRPCFRIVLAERLAGRDTEVSFSLVFSRQVCFLSGIRQTFHFASCKLRLGKSVEMDKKAIIFALHRIA